MSGVKGRSGRKGFRAEFNAACMLGTASGILQNALTSDKLDLSEQERTRRVIANNVFQKLAPTKIEHSGEIEHKITTVNFADVKPTANS